MILSRCGIGIGYFIVNQSGGLYGYRGNLTTLMLADYTEAPVCHVDDLVDGQLKLVHVGDTDVLLARADGQFYALHPKCSHYQGPLVKGLLNGHRLVCPWHNACFDIRDGHRQ